MFSFCFLPTWRFFLFRFTMDLNALGPAGRPLIWAMKCSVPARSADAVHDDGFLTLRHARSQSLGCGTAPCSSKSSSTSRRLSCSTSRARSRSRLEFLTLQIQGVGEDGFIKAANLGVSIEEPVALTGDASFGLLWFSLKCPMASPLGPFARPGTRSLFEIHKK